MTHATVPLVDGPPGPALTADERDELLRLRRQNEALRTAGPRPRTSSGGVHSSPRC